MSHQNNNMARTRPPSKQRELVLQKGHRTGQQADDVVAKPQTFVLESILHWIHFRLVLERHHGDGVGGAETVVAGWLYDQSK
jgi:hypothetical protein